MRWLRWAQALARRWHRPDPHVEHPRLGAGDPLGGITEGQATVSGLIEGTATASEVDAGLPLVEVRPGRVAPPGQAHGDQRADID
jgi:hypothetical protein